MGLLNIVAKFLIRPDSPSGTFMVEKGHIKIFGVDDATAALLQTEFPELQLIPTASTSAVAAAAFSGSGTLYTSHGEDAGDAPIELDEAFTSLTAYLKALDQQEFNVVSAFKDDLQDKSHENSYRIYMWTMQK